MVKLWKFPPRDPDKDKNFPMTTSIQHYTRSLSAIRQKKKKGHTNIPLLYNLAIPFPGITYA